MSKQKIDEKLMMTDLQLNHATKGFLQEIANEKTGVYLIIGPTSAGKTTLMNQYLKCFPQNVKKVTYCDSKTEYSSNGTPNSLYMDHENNKTFENATVKFEDVNNANIIIHDHHGMNYSEVISSIQELFMLSTRANVAITSHFGQREGVSGFLEWFRDTPNFKMGDYSMLRRVKAITFVQSVTVASEKRFINESLVVNGSNIEKLLKASKGTLRKIVDAEIHSQGGVTISDQLRLLRKNPTSTSLAIRTRENENNPHDWEDFYLDRTNNGRNEDKVNLSRQNRSSLYPTVSDATITFSEIDNFLQIVKEEAKSDVYSIDVSYRHGTDLCVADGELMFGFSNEVFNYDPLSGNFDLLALERRKLEDDELLPQLENFLKLPAVVEAVEFANNAARILGLEVADKVTVSIISGVSERSVHEVIAEPEKYPTNPVRNEYKVMPLHDRKKLAADYHVEVTD